VTQVTVFIGNFDAVYESLSTLLLCTAVVPTSPRELQRAGRSETTECPAKHMSVGTATRPHEGAL